MLRIPKQQERLEQLNKIAITQMKSLVGNKQIKKLKQRWLRKRKQPPMALTKYCFTHAQREGEG